MEQDLFAYRESLQESLLCCCIKVMAAILLSPYFRPSPSSTAALLATCLQVDMADNLDPNGDSSSPANSPGPTPVNSPDSSPEVSPMPSPYVSPVSSLPELPHLPVDRCLSPVVLRRRLAISSGENGQDDDDAVPPYNSRPRMKRRGAISYGPNDSPAMYIRYLGKLLHWTAVQCEITIAFSLFLQLKLLQLVT